MQVRQKARGHAPADTTAVPYSRRIRALLEDVAEGKTGIEEAFLSLGNLAFSDLGFAKVDHHREMRQGFCEIVYAEGKSNEQIRQIIARLISENSGSVLVTRANAAQLGIVAELASSSQLTITEAPGCGADA